MKIYQKDARNLRVIITHRLGIYVPIVFVSNPSILFKTHRILFKTHRILFKTHRILFKTHRTEF